MKKRKQSKESFLLHILETDKLLCLEATPEIKNLYVVDNCVKGYFQIDGRPITSPIVKIFEIDENGNEIDKSTPVVKQNMLEFLQKLASQNINGNELIKESINKDIVKVSLHSQLQKQGKNKPAQNTIFDIIESETDTKNKEELLQQKDEYRIEVVGLDLSKSQEKALFAIQTMLNNTDYKGNMAGKEIHSKAMSFDGHLPSLRFTPSEYLEKFGVNKKDYGRGYLEFVSNERDEALKALRDLSQKRFLMFYTKKYWLDKVKDYRWDVIRTIRPLINITEGFEQLNKKEISTLLDVNNTLANEKLTTIVIEPNPILIDQIDTYFVLKPANCYQEIKLLVGNASKFVYRFVDYLLTEVAQRTRKKNGITDYQIKINYETLGTILRMDSYIKTRNWKKMRAAINNCYETATKLGYLNDFRIEQHGVTKEIDILILNPDKFHKIDEINKRREEIDQQYGSNMLPKELNEVF